jgi:hypothetical protein
VKLWLTPGVFPPRDGYCDDEDIPPREQLSFWRELHTAQTLLVVTLLETINNVDLQEHLSRLSKACANSKRKRQPQLHFFSSA